MIKAIIFDFNGVIADDETPHVTCFQQALAEAGLSLKKDEYYGAYLGMDERTCASMLLTARDGFCDAQLLSHITRRKADLFRAYTTLHKPELFPGVVELVRGLRGNYRLAIASGGRREQISAALEHSPIERDFDVIVSAEDCPTGKPEPAIYRLTCEQLNKGRGEIQSIDPKECLVVEDSLAGIRAGKAAGMWVLAVATTYPVDKLNEADDVVVSLKDISFDDVIARIGQISQGSRFARTQPE